MNKRSAVFSIVAGIVFTAVFSLAVFASSGGDATAPPKGIPPSTNPAINPAGAPSDIKSPIEAMGFGDYRAVIHAHSFLSHDSQGTAQRMVQAAQTAGINIILMADHPSSYSVLHGVRGMHGGVYFLPGVELNRGGASLLSLDLKENIKSNDTQGTVDEIHKQDGVAFISHIEGFGDWDATGFDGMEIYNTHYDAILDKKIDKTIALVPYLEKNPERVWLSILDRPIVYLEAWDRELQKRKMTGIAANDSHENVVYNGVQLDTYERSYGLVSTHLFLQELSEAEILRSLKRGYAYVCFDIFASCRGFSFIATDGKEIAIMGDEYSLSREGTSKMKVSVPAEAKIRLLKDGKVFKEVTGSELEIDITEAGVYRAEADIVTKKAKKPQQWIYSNPIYVRK